MSQYLIAYHSGRTPESPEEGAKLAAKWEAWVGELGDAMVNPGTPLGKSKIVTADGVSDGGGSTTLMGYSIVKAESLDDALELAQTCPHLEIGTLEVAEVKSM